MGSSRMFPTSNVRRQRIHAGAGGGEMIPLVGYDHVVTNAYTRRLFVYRETLDPEVLAASLKAVLQHFPVFAGTLMLEDGQPAICCNDQGAEFVVQDCSEALQVERLTAQSAAMGHELAEVRNPVTIFRTRPALLIVVLTQMRGGGSVLGVSNCHGVSDGGAMTHFLMTWMRLAHGECDLPAPILDRSLISRLGDGYDGGAPGGATDYAAQSFVQHAFTGLRVISQGRMSQKRFFHYTAGELGALKSLAADAEDDETPISRFDILTVHLWREVAESRGRERGCWLSSLLDLRHRKELDIPATLVANAFISRELEIPLSQLRACSTPELARAYRQAQQRPVDAEALGRDIAYLREARRRGHAWFMSRFAINQSCGGLMINNRLRMREYELDFGFGTPAIFDSYAPCARVVYIVPSERPEEGGCTAQILGPPRELKPIRRLPRELA